MDSKAVAISSKAVAATSKAIGTDSKTVGVSLERVAGDKNQEFLQCEAIRAGGRPRRLPAEANRFNPKGRGARPSLGAAMSEASCAGNRHQTCVAGGVAAAGDVRTPHFEDASRRLAAVGADGAGRKRETAGEGCLTNWILVSTSALILAFSPGEKEPAMEAALFSAARPANPAV